MPSAWLTIYAQIEAPWLERTAQSAGMRGYELAALVSVLLISIISGLIGSLVVGNRMAFFSDAMSHCAFAGISLGLLIALSAGVAPNSDSLRWIIPLSMALFGSLAGTGIAFVREKTALASDTVIGVFFAASIGFGAMMLTAFQDKRLFDPERFLFGGPSYAQVHDLLLLAILAVLLIVVLVWRYNQFLLISLNPSLARARGISIAVNNYLFILLLSLVVNFSISAVGVMLINALLIVPAAAACNFASNLRQTFRYTLGISVVCGYVGLFLSTSLRFEIAGQARQFGPSGLIIMLTVGVFFVSLTTAYLRRKFSYLG